MSRTVFFKHAKNFVSKAERRGADNMEVKVSIQTAFNVLCQVCGETFGYQESRHRNCPACGSDERFHVANIMRLWGPGDFVPTKSEPAKVIDSWREKDDVYYLIEGIDSKRTGRFSQSAIQKGYARL